MSGGVVTAVRPGSVADEAGIRPGDRLTAISGRLLRDELDYRFHASAADLTLHVRAAGGDEWLVEVEKDPAEDLGLSFAEPLFDGVRRCHDKCLFCFVDQLPAGLRPSLYLKDDDYRLSFLHGNFITLDNLTAADWRRLAEQRLSPLYVSVHATDTAVRRRLMSPAASDIMSGLRRLAAWRIAIHAQIVLCPGINDGAVLARTLADLYSLGDGVVSVGIVPVGLTAYRPAGHLVPLDRKGAAALVELERAQRGRRPGWLQLADEIYLSADEPLPPAWAYAGYPQFANGIGMARSLADEAAEAIPAVPEGSGRTVTVVTGVLAAPLLHRVLEPMRAKGYAIVVLPVANTLFGPGVTVAGLIAGKDVSAALAGQADKGPALVPGSALLGGHRFVDDMTLAQVAGETGRAVRDGGRDGLDLVRSIREVDR